MNIMTENRIGFCKKRLLSVKYEITVLPQKVFLRGIYLIQPLGNFLEISSSGSVGDIIKFGSTFKGRMEVKGLLIIAEGS